MMVTLLHCVCVILLLLHTTDCGSQPVISIEADRGGIGLICETVGWYNEPEIKWLDSEGTILAEGFTDMLRDSEGFHTVRLKATVQPSDTNRFICRVKSQGHSEVEMKKAEIYIGYEVFYHMGPAVEAMLMLLGALVIGSAVVVCFLVICFRKKGRTKRGALTKKKDIFAEQLDLVNTGGYQECTEIHYDHETIRKHAVEVTLDADSAHPKLILSADGKQVRCGNKGQLLSDNPERFDACLCVLGKEGFSSGSFYYEVQVKNKNDWDLGVARESINRKGDITLSPRYGIWSVSLRDGDEYKGNASPAVVLHLRQKPQKVGVFVDYEEGKVSFYNAEGRSHIYSFTGCIFNKEKLYPFFSPCLLDGRKSAPLVICPVDVKVESSVEPESGRESVL